MSASGRRFVYVPARRRWRFPKEGGQSAQALRRSRGGFSTKVHITVDGLGNPLRFILTGGQENDITQAEVLLVAMPENTSLETKDMTPRDCATTFWLRV